MPYQFRGKYFEEFNIGDEFYAPSRTITEADIVTFASFSEDWNPLHTDEEFAKKGPFKTRIAHGMLSLSLATGLMDKIGIVEGTCLAFMGLTWRFIKAVKNGDTITMKMAVKEKKKTKKPGRGIVNFDVSILNQDEEVVSEGVWDLMQTCKEE